MHRGLRKSKGTGDTYSFDLFGASVRTAISGEGPPSFKLETHECSRNYPNLSIMDSDDIQEGRNVKHREEELIQL